MSLAVRNMTTPNFLVLCIDDIRDGIWEGRIYHRYSDEPIRFGGVVKMLKSMGDFYTMIRYPESSTKIRSFSDEPSQPVRQLVSRVDQEELISHRGERATFFVYVQYRQNATWQGEMQIPGQPEMMKFDSELDLLKLIENNM